MTTRMSFSLMTKKAKQYFKLIRAFCIVPFKAYRRQLRKANKIGTWRNSSTKLFLNYKNSKSMQLLEND
jgi:hypothetical protein